MKLVEIFQDNMILQRGKEICLWGTSEEEKEIAAKIDGKEVCTAKIPSGKFTIFLPPQEAKENVKLEVGDVVINSVDIGEVFVASGQSNMEFLLEYEENYPQEKDSPEDSHLRMYTVGRYSFEGEKEMGYKSWNKWDRWYSYTKADRASFSAPAAYFAKELREKGVPVGIINCSWGGTIAVSWVNEECIKNEKAFASQVEYAEKLNQIIEENNLWQAKQDFRQKGASQDNEEMTRTIMTVTSEPPAEADTDSSDFIPAEFKGHGVEAADLMYRAKGDPNYPGILYSMMLEKLLGYTVQGVLWYQGESDQDHASGYGALLTGLIECWRKEWKKVNPHQETLPFIFVQMAPFGQWLYNKGHNFPELRQQQLNVSRNEKDAYIVSIGDIGNVYDIHPKNKKDVGHRMALLAKKYIYGENILAEAPVVKSAEKAEAGLCISFENAEGLNIKEQDNTSYNGFSNIREEFIPLLEFTHFNHA